MQSHNGHNRAPDPRYEEERRQRALTNRLLLVIGVLLGVLTPMLLKRFLF